MNKFLFLVYNVGLLLSFLGSILFTIFVLPYLFDLASTEGVSIVGLRWIYYSIVMFFHLPFAYALKQVYTILKRLKEDNLFQEKISSNLRKIIYSATIIFILHSLALLIMIIVDNYSTLFGMLSIMVLVISFLFASYTYIFRLVLDKGITIKKENELTI